MAFSNTYDTANTGSAVSNREGLSDILTIFAPEETPVLSTLGKEKVPSTFFEWTVDGLAAPVTAMTLLLTLTSLLLVLVLATTFRSFAVTTWCPIYRKLLIR